MKWFPMLFALRVLVVCSLAGTVWAVPTYKKFSLASTRRPYFTLTFDDKFLIVSVLSDSVINAEQLLRRDLVVRDSVVLKSGVPISPRSILLDRSGLHFRDSVYPYSRIHDMALTTRNKQTLFTFFTDDDSSAVVRRGDRLTFGEDITIDTGVFARGVVFSVLGNVLVSGEANRDVVSLFGNVTVSPKATVRGGVGSLNGQITVSKEASVYGEIYSSSARRGARKHSLRTQIDALEYLASFRYNRVDGATPDVGLKFNDRDSLIPIVWARAGYAFASKRWHYDLGLEQTLLRSTSLSLGGHLYRRLSSGDDWIVSDIENLAYTLFLTEDLKNYYESEGGALYAHYAPLPRLSLGTEYRNERTRWFDAHRNLWSLFGRGKKFGENFGTVPTSYREQGRGDIEARTLAFVRVHADYHTGDSEGRPRPSSWNLSGEFELSQRGLKSDFNYRRYSLNVRRYQRFNRYTILLAKLSAGNSDGYLPMHKRYFLGGLGTLHGYSQDEFMGTRYWMANAEYRISFSSTEFAVSFLWDLAQIADDRKLGQAEVRHSLGVALAFDNYFKITLAKRLDRATSDNPRFFVRFEQIF